MRIGVMLRALEEKGGISVYANNIVKELISIDERNEYVLFYREAGSLGRFSKHVNVKERYLRAPTKALWDQMAVPLACARERIDLLFHPKFTVPFLAPCPAVMVVHGADWFFPDQARFYKPLDVRYARVVMPWYFRKAAKVLSVSRLTTENYHKVMNIPPGKLETVYFGPGRHFARVDSEADLERVRSRYGLPKRFILSLAKLGDGNRKNFTGLMEGYAHYHARADHPLKLVVGGIDCYQLAEQHAVPTHGYGGDLVFPGWIDQEDLPAVYTMADLFLYVSNLEAFPIPITEAMACGTPIVTSSVNGLEELAGNAALLVDPADPNDIALAVARVLNDEPLRRELSERGLERSSLFSMERCALETVRIFEELTS